MLTYVGAEGSSWSASSAGKSSFKPVRLHFSATYVNPLWETYRGYAYPVRCVQAFTFVAISFLFLIFAGDSDKSGV